MNGQKMKGQDGDHDFDSWRPNSHFSALSSQSTQQSADPYQMSYYAPPAQPPPPMFPYSDSMASSAPTWSSDTTMTFLGGYTPETGQHSGQHHANAYTMEAMFGSAQNTYGFGNQFNTSNAFNAFFPSNSEPFWGGGASKPTPRGNQYRMDDQSSQQYQNQQQQQQYHHYGNEGQQPPDQQLKRVEQGIAGLGLEPMKANDHSFKGAFDKKFDSLSSGAVGPKKMSWASIASQPAKPVPKSLKSKMSSNVGSVLSQGSKHLPSMDPIGTWESKNGSTSAVKTPPHQTTAPPQQQPPLRPPIQQLQASSSSAQPQWTRGGRGDGRGTEQTSRSAVNATNASEQLPSVSASVRETAVGGGGGAMGSALHPVLDKLRVENNYNPKEWDLNPRNARFFIIKSYSEDDIHRSIKYSIWCSTEHGNKRLDNAFKQHESKGPIYLLFSVNGSGHFCGMAQMMSSVDYASSSSVWAQDKWKGQFRVKWIYVKDVPNAQLRHIRLENNENKPVTNSRDTQEVPFEKGKQVIKIMHHFRHTTSIFDDFLHYEKRQEEESQRRTDPLPSSSPIAGTQPPQPPQQQQPPPPSAKSEKRRERNDWNKN